MKIVGATDFGGFWAFEWACHLDQSIGIDELNTIQLTFFI